jgi:hypothetical protein
MHRGCKIQVCAAIEIVVSVAAATAVRADITTTISGFGTVGGTFTSDSRYAYVHDPTEFTGASNQFDLGLESRLGLQARFDFGSGLSITAQEVFRQRGNTDFDPGTEWLYVQYSPNSDWQLRLGRVVMAAYLYSDSRQVGYALPWFRAPNELYLTLPYEYLDGGQVSWRKTLGQFTVNLEASYGNSQGAFQIGSGAAVQTYHPKDVLNTAASVEYESLLLRVARTHLNVPFTLPLSPTFSLDYQLHEDFTTVGLQYDDGKALVLGEWARSQENDAPVLNEPLGRSSEWYLAAGWHFGKFLPLLMYGNAKPEKGLTGPAGTHGTWSANLRYDVASNVALKAEISRPQVANGFYWANTANYVSDARVYVFSFGADFVF